MRKWRVGYLPTDGGGDKRGWSLRGNIVYPLLSVDDKLLGWIGRDPAHAEKLAEWERSDRSKKEPAKHRFPKGLHRGLEFFGQQVSRLKEPGYREAIERHGILVVEGFNDVIALDAIGVPSIGIMSNRMTEAQIEKLALWARRLAGGRVSLMLDCEETGDTGAKEAAWQLLQRGLDVRLAWSQSMHGGRFRGRQPESLSAEEWQEAIEAAIVR
jgi:5S rRNA maturation endonuclease (ribonuclease M5)